MRADVMLLYIVRFHKKLGYLPRTDRATRCQSEACQLHVQTVRQMHSILNGVRHVDRHVVNSHDSSIVL